MLAAKAAEEKRVKDKEERVRYVLQFTHPTILNSLICTYLVTSVFSI